MKISNKNESIFLFLGDLFFMTVSLFLMLLFRYGEANFDTRLIEHIGPFAMLFVVWFLVFFITGLYEKHTLFLKSKLPSLLLSTQIANTLIAIIFFYFIPYFGIAPKTNLFIYLVLSFGLLFIWRHAALGLIGSRRRYKAVLVGSGSDIDDLVREVNNNRRYSINVIATIDPSVCTKEGCHTHIQQAIKEGASLVILDTHHPVIESILPDLYKLLFSGVRFIDITRVYEEVFDRIPISLVKHSWFLEHLAQEKHWYDIIKRGMDISAGIICGLLSLAVYPFVIFAIKLEDGGPAFYKALRVGENGKIIEIIKFRTMTSCDTPHQALATKAVPTTVGTFLRKSRIDELPQLWNIVKGDLSLVGPRPEINTIATAYEEHIPYYNVRHLIKPGLSGWAQMYGEHAHGGVGIEETKNKLSYDLYYIKNRSIILDVKVALKTLRMFFTRAGK